MAKKDDLTQVLSEADMSAFEQILNAGEKELQSGADAIRKQDRYDFSKSLGGSKTHMGRAAWAAKTDDDKKFLKDVLRNTAESESKPGLAPKVIDRSYKMQSLPENAFMPKLRNALGGGLKKIAPAAKLIGRAAGPVGAAYGMLDQEELGPQEGTLERKLEDGTITPEERQILMSRNQPKPKKELFGNVMKKLRGE